ncbi:MAG: alpha/beta fold hydrolase [Candidatus Lokiarchaeota archaeon]|nr:alpha/beta fold hydrolase [Candidatus Lokiarchaeota archaeon]
MTHKDHHQLKKLLIFIIILIITLTSLQLNKTQSYNKYERVQFESSGATLYANLYYPSKTLEFQAQRPLVIYCHGIGSKRDFDLRIPIEFTKRGFYVAALDYQGHGESGGNINNLDTITGIPALAQDCSNLLDELETLPFYRDVDASQIGLIGHSLGGMVVLMNQALDPRFQVTVALAPLFNFTPPRYGFVYNEDFINYIPVNLLNEENTQNLLVIMHVDDEALDFSDNALKAQELTNCTVIPIEGFLLGGGHQLFSNEVLIESINWFESHFFGSPNINGCIVITFYFNYALIFINIILIFISVISLISISSRLFFKKDKKNEHFNSLDIEIPLNTSNKRKLIITTTLYIGAFLLNWALFEKFYGLIGILYASILMLVSFAAIRIIRFLKKPKDARNLIIFKQRIKNQFKLKYLIFTLICATYFIAIYMLFSFYYPFGFVWPSNFVVDFILSYLALPVFFSIEILLRKVIYPRLNFLKSEDSKNRVLIFTAIIITITMMALTRQLSYLPSVLFMYIVLLLVIIQNTKIFQNVKSFYPVVIISFTIVQLFFAAVISNAIGVSTVI